MRRTWLLLLLLPALMLPVVACGGKKKTEAEATRPAATSASGSNADRPTATRPAATTAPSGGATSGCESELAAVEQAMKNVKSFRANMSLEVSGAPTQTGTIEFVAPDRSHVTFAGIELISIGNDLYTKIGPTWQKGTGGAGIDTKSLTDSLAGVSCSGLTKGGTETINGQRCQMYSYTAAGAGVQVCVANNLPVRVVTSGGGSKVTIDFSSVNGNISIQPPI